MTSGEESKFSDLNYLETELANLTNGSKLLHVEWPNKLEPLPEARIALSLMCVGQGKHAPAISLALRGHLMSRWRSGPVRPVWVWGFQTVLTTIVHAEAMLADSPALGADGVLPELEDLCTVALGYAYRMSRDACKVYGGDSDAFRIIMGKTKIWADRIGGPTPGIDDKFAEKFMQSQKRVLAWARMHEKYAVELRGRQEGGHG